jgi:hypothetical protein
MMYQDDGDDDDDDVMMMINSVRYASRISVMLSR